MLRKKKGEVNEKRGEGKNIIRLEKKGKERRSEEKRKRPKRAFHTHIHTQTCNKAYSTQTNKQNKNTPANDPPSQYGM